MISHINISYFPGYSGIILIAVFMGFILNLIDSLK